MHDWTDAQSVRRLTREGVNAFAAVKTWIEKNEKENPDVAGGEKGISEVAGGGLRTRFTKRIQAKLRELFPDPESSPTAPFPSCGG